MSNDHISTIKTVGGALFMAVIFSVILANVAAVAFDIGSTPQEASVNPVTGQEITVHKLDSGGDPTFRATRENALRFDGDDSVDAATPSLTGGWTVCAVAELNTTATDPNGTYTVAAYENASILLEYDAGDWSAYYQNETGADGKSTINATSPGSFTAVCGRYNASSNTLHVARDGAFSSGVHLDNTTDSRNVSSGWVGRLDELRTFNNSVSNRSIKQYADDPITAIPGANRSSRMMFDEGTGSTTRVFFADATADIKGATWTSGVADPGLKEGVDYTLLSTSPVRFKTLAGGYLDGAPIVHIEEGPGPFVALIRTAFNIGGAAFIVVALGLLAFAGGRVMDELGISRF